MEADGSVGSESLGTVTSRWATALSATLAVSLLPLFILSQWLALRWQLPTRFWFNAIFATTCVFLLLMGWKRVPRWLHWLGFALAGVLAVSWLVNAVPASVVLRGTFPYAVPVVALAGGFAARLSQKARDTAVAGHVVAVIALAATSVLQLIVGESAFRWFGQDLEYPRWWERGRATGLVANPGRLAHVGLIAAAIAPRGPGRWIAVSAAAVVVAASGGRVALAGAALLLGVSLLFWRSPDRRWYLVAAATIVVVFALILTSSEVAREDFFARTEATVDEVTRADTVVDDARVASLRAGIQAWRGAPVIGWGPGRFGSTTAWATGSELHERFALPDLRSEQFAEQLRQSGQTRDVDVGTAQLDIGLVQAMAETGLAGTMALLLLLVGLAWEAGRRAMAVPFALAGLVLLFSISGPGVVDPSLALVALWWAGATVRG